MFEQRGLPRHEAEGKSTVGGAVKMPLNQFVHEEDPANECARTGLDDRTRQDRATGTEIACDCGPGQIR